MIGCAGSVLAQRANSMTVRFYEETVQIPAGISDLEAFRRWAKSEDFPRTAGSPFSADKSWWT